MNPADIISALANHLWQSTAAVVFIGIVTLALRKNPARIRYWLWMIASLKFLVPISLLILLGSSMQPVPEPVARPAVSVVLGQITEPFSRYSKTTAVGQKTSESTTAPLRASLINRDALAIALAFVWLTGFLAACVGWWRDWRKIRAAVREGCQIGVIERVPVLSSPALLEPGVFGIRRPLLLIPKGVQERLTAPQFSAVIAHEMCHVRRRDNLSAALHMLVEALFWFHPLVWWIRARLLEERERACDEAVIEFGNEAETYAEGILNVCKLYFESPLPCVSGVTGADLKKRILRIVTGQVTRKLDLGRKLLLGAAAVLAIVAPVSFGLLHVVQVQAQTATQDLAGTWQGTLKAGKDLRTVLKVTKAGTGYQAKFYSIDQGPGGMPVTSITQQGSTVKYSLVMIDGSYEGKLSPDGNTITGIWTQAGRPLPLTLTRATPETAWTLPEPPPRLKPMTANANPVFEVATVKPSKPDVQGKGFMVRPRHFATIGTTLDDLMTFAYEIQAKQITKGAPWMSSEKFDLDGQPDGEGQPNEQQWKAMLQKLLADRFQLKFHREQKELAVYALTVAKSGPKLTKSQGDPNGLPALFFTGFGRLAVSNATVGDFARVMQGAVLDRPVVDQTGLPGRWDFVLNWTPDESQFGGLGLKVPPPSNAPDAPPPLFTAMPQELGLKFDPTKASVDILAIDHVEKPSAN